MRRLLVALGAVLLATPISLAGAAETGTIAGTVTNAATGRPQQGATVTLIGASEDGGERIERDAVSDRRGRYRFTGLPAGDDRIYTVDVTYDGGLFPGSALQIPSDTEETPVIEATTRVWDTTDDPTSIIVQRMSIFVTPGADGRLDVIESLVAVNQSNEAYIGRGAGEGGAPGETPTLGAALPRGAAEDGVEIIDASLEVPVILPTDFGFGITSAIPPGETRITYRYRVPGDAGGYDLSRVAVYPTLSIAVHAPEDFEIDSNRLETDGTVVVGDTEYARSTSDEAVEAGNPIQISALALADPSGSAALAIAAAVAGLLAMAGAIVLWSRRRSRTRAEVPRGRDELLDAIARLDISHERGDLGTEEWTARRGELKERLAASEPRP